MKDLRAIRLGGLSSGFTSVSASYPFDLLKRRLQLSNELGNPQYNSSLDCIKHIYIKNGIRGFYSGLFPCYMKLIPANCIFFYTIELFKTI